jgi:hypothetical protein
VVTPARVIGDRSANRVIVMITGGAAAAGSPLPEEVLDVAQRPETRTGESEDSWDAT